jgi:tetratricopeptide (TPR) repeat protein
MLLARLSYAYFEEGNYEKAFEISSKACRHAPHNPLVMWDHARALFGIKRPSESLRILRRILRMSTRKISETMKWRENKVVDFQNTCRFEMALCYIQLDRLALAIRWMERHLSHRRSGLRSYYLIDSVKRTLNRTKALKKKTDNNERRLWISFMEVESLKRDKRIKYRRGFTTGLTIARFAKEAEDSLKKALANWDFRLLRAESTEEYARRVLKFRVTDEVDELASKVRKTKAPQFTEFHMYPYVSKKR